MGRRFPRPASAALGSALDGATPQSNLAVAQTVWPQVVGSAISNATEPVAERAGMLSVRCESATWAEELSLMEDDLLRGLRERLGKRSPTAIKFLAG